MTMLDLVALATLDRALATSIAAAPREHPTRNDKSADRAACPYAGQRAA